ncbi:sodium channel regulatory subunit beta-4-like [Mustelus asterias]
MKPQKVSMDFCGVDSAKIFPGRLFVAILIALVQFQDNVAVEVNIGKKPTIEVLNGTDVILPCIFSSCMDYKDSSFWWTFQKNETERAERIIQIRLKDKRPFVTPLIADNRFILVGEIKDKNLSLLLTDADFEDTGLYTCFFKNPQEMNQEANATLRLIVVSQLIEVDNTLTVIIASVVGGVIGFLILIFIIKKLVKFIIKQVGKKKKECLVNSCANTEHGHYGSKSNLKTPPKA